MDPYVSRADIAARPAPAREQTMLSRLRGDYFFSISAICQTVVLFVMVATAAILLFRWGVLHAVFAGDGAASASEACRVAHGACWAVIGDKLRLILFGVYPFEEQWRPAIASILMVCLYGLSVQRALWRMLLFWLWLGVLTIVGVLMWGGVLGLRYVPDSEWGGLPITLILSTFGLALAFPLAVLLALARQADNIPILQTPAVVFIEFARGIPLLVVLFMASVMLPLFLPPGIEISKLLRVLIAFALFAAAYLAEVIRGGLQAIPIGQYEAATALSLGYWRRMYWVILPQALTIVIPGIVNIFIGFFKATSIVVVVGIFDLMTAAKRAVADPLWQGFGIEVYLFAGLIYFVFCFSLSRYSAGLERHLDRGERQRATVS
ncbi:MAG: amino acid ABC transporter permease [Burkholderiaceae bacterium]